MAVTLAQLEDDARDWGEKELDNHISPADAARRINRGYRRLQNLIRRLTKGAFFRVSLDFQITSGNTFTMPMTPPTAFLRMRQLYWRPGGAGALPDDIVPLGRWVDEELPTGIRSYQVVGGNQVEIYPASDAPGYYRARYETRLQDLAGSSPGPQVDMDPRLEEWRDYVALWAGRSFRGKEESEYEELTLEINSLEQEITATYAGGVDLEPDRIADVYARPYELPRLPRP